MKIIINRGFCMNLSRIVVLRNSQKVVDYKIDNDICEFKAEKGDRIEVKLRNLDATLSSVASFVCHDGNATVSVSPTMLTRRWEMANYKILPYLSILLIVFRVVVKSEMFVWLGTAVLILTVVS